MRQLILLRHGESSWNKTNQFTGWTDVDLSHKGIEEARSAGRLLHNLGIRFDLAYTSYLKRAIRTLWIVLEEMNLMWIPVHSDWRLNERHYGALQGLHKAEITDQYGKDQVFLWRRSFLVRPPALDPQDPRHPRFDPKYAGIPFEQLPVGECLKDTLDRVMACWEQRILPDLQLGKQILITGHGNSLRAFVKHLDRIPDEEVNSLSIPTGIPIMYELDQNCLPIRRSYLGDPDTVQKAVEAAAKAARVKGSQE